MNEYDPWGGVSRSEISQSVICDATHRFTGQELDAETGLYYYGGRYYDPEISRFISADPFVQDEEDPQNLNRYSYVNNDPINYTDPSGYFYFSKHSEFNVAGFILGFLSGGIWGALQGAGIVNVDFGLSSNAVHVFQILEGIYKLLTLNPQGIFEISAGAVGLSGASGAERASALLALMGGAITTGNSGGSGGAANEGGIDLSTLGGPNLVKIERGARRPGGDIETVYGETRGLYPQLNRVVKDPYRAATDPRNWDAQSFEDLQRARADIAQVYRNGGITWSEAPPPSSDALSTSQWQRGVYAAARASDLPSNVRHYFLRAHKGPQFKQIHINPATGKLYPINRTYGPFINVGGGDVPRSTLVYIDFYEGIPR